MFKNKLIFLVPIIFFITSCGGTWDSVKRGLTGQKQNSSDEFMVQKKDPLILPPDFETLPTPGDREAAQEEISSFEKKLKTTSSSEDISSIAGSAEESILQKIRKK